MLRRTGLRGRISRVTGIWAGIYGYKTQIFVSGGSVTRAASLRGVALNPKELGLIVRVARNQFYLLLSLLVAAALLFPCLRRSDECNGSAKSLRKVVVS